MYCHPRSQGRNHEGILEMRADGATWMIIVQGPSSVLPQDVSLGSLILVDFPLHTYAICHQSTTQCQNHKDMSMMRVDDPVLDVIREVAKVLLVCLESTETMGCIEANREWRERCEYVLE